MHRQSLGSPGSKLHNHGVGGGAVKEENLTVEDQNRKDQVSSLINDDEDNKSQKPHKSTLKPERFVHSIPLLVVVCFLVLYLSSHDPSQIDLAAQFNDFNQLSKPLDLTESDDFGRVLEVKKGDVLAIRSLRNLQEIGKRVPEYRFHRKMGDF
ncbi:uncharacterized protein LOC132285623 [Cornus florida]|uniref:uncharacterized protein LOC132285623 n=1 Tax=Cornus florida TaxID=4283 RepID=UPI002899C28C|nr:uncharacterized protein LOC132285623 [Cornus florida]